MAGMKSFYFYVQVQLYKLAIPVDMCFCIQQGDTTKRFTKMADLFEFPLPPGRRSRRFVGWWTIGLQRFGHVERPSTSEGWLLDGSRYQEPNWGDGPHKTWRRLILIVWSILWTCWHVLILHMCTLYICNYMYMYMCMCIYIYIQYIHMYTVYVHIYIYIYTYIHTYSWGWTWLMETWRFHKQHRGFIWPLDIFV